MGGGRNGPKRWRGAATKIDALERQKVDIDAAIAELNEFAAVLQAGEDADQKG